MPRRLTFAGSSAKIRPAAREIRTPDKRERDQFYGSKPWREVRSAYLAENPLCVNCLGKGLVVEADTVHHLKERLDFPELALCWSNLEASCKACHTERHKLKKEKRAYVEAVPALPLPGGDE